jgi:hypothetical protein
MGGQRVVFVVACGVLLTSSAWGCAPRRPAVPFDSKSLLSALAEPAASIVEGDRAVRTKFALHADAIVCVAEPFGADPAGVTAVENVQTIYALAYCASVDLGRRLDEAETAILPVAINAKDRTAVAPGEADYQGDVRRIIPSRYWTAAFAGLSDPGGDRRKLQARLAAYETGR